MPERRVPRDPSPEHQGRAANDFSRGRGTRVPRDPPRDESHSSTTATFSAGTRSIVAPISLNKESHGNNNNRQRQPPPTTSKTANLKTTKVQIHRIEPTNQAQQGGYNNANNNNGPYQRPDYPYPDRSTILSTSSSVDSDPYQYRPYQTQSPNDEFMRGQQQQDMNVYK